MSSRGHNGKIPVKPFQESPYDVMNCSTPIHYPVNSFIGDGIFKKKTQLKFDFWNSDHMSFVHL